MWKLLKNLLCSHTNQTIRVVDSSVTIEKTAVFCKDCNKRLTPYKYET